MGGVQCQIIIKADLRAFFEHPEIYEAISEKAAWKSKIDAALAKEYEQWKEAEVIGLLELWKDLYLEYRNETE